MKINNLHITAFGKLTDVTMVFEPGMNLFTGDNEYGKSTILSFIRAMFYGFSGRASTRIRDNDRRKFTPWIGMPFGGSIEFQHTGKTYLLEKTFSRKKADDKVVLTLIPSGQKTDLAQKEVGEYLFAISESEFVNTVFVGQLSSNIMGTDKETSDISARLANLADTGSELFSHEEIKARLVSASSKLYALRGPGGLIPRIEDELADLEEKEKDLSDSQEQTEILRKEIEDGLERQKRIGESILSTGRLLEEKKKKSELLLADIQQENIYLQKALQKKLLDEERANANADFENARREHMLQRQEMRSQLSEERFRAEEELGRLHIQNDQIRERSALLAADIDALLMTEDMLCRENKALYENKANETEQLEEEILAVSSEIKALIQLREEARKGLTTIFVYKMHVRRYEILFIAALAVSLTAYAFMRDPVQLAGLIFLVFTVGLHLSNWFQIRSVEKTIIEKSMAHEAKMKIYENAAASQYDRQTALTDSQKRLEELHMQKLRIKENEQKDMAFNEHLTTLAQEHLSSCRARSDQFTDPSGEESGAVHKAEPKTETLPENPETVIDTAALEMQMKSDEFQLSGIRNEISMILLQEEKLKTEITAIRVDIARKETTRENFLSQETDRSWLLEQRALLTERLGDAKAYHRALLTAQQVLDEAFSEMEDYFAPQVNEKAGEYLDKLTEGAYSTLHVDRSFGIDIASEGSYSFHKSDFFSGGTVDQIYFALRLAIADLVQPSDDKMPLLLDDTFVQYDDKRAKAGLTLLDELSLDRQVVLFTCHGRMSDLYASIKEDKGSLK